MAPLMVQIRPATADIANLARRGDNARAACRHEQPHERWKNPGLDGGLDALLMLVGEVHQEADARVDTSGGRGGDRSGEERGRGQRGGGGGGG